MSGDAGRQNDPRSYPCAVCGVPGHAHGVGDNFAVGHPYEVETPVPEQPATAPHRNDTGMIRPVEVWQDEYGDAYWAEGHIDPATFIAAVRADLIECGLDPDYRADLIECGLDPDEPPGIETIPVQHFWRRPAEDDDERFYLCRPDHPDARPITRQACQ